MIMSEKRECFLLVLHFIWIQPILDPLFAAIIVFALVKVLVVHFKLSLSTRHAHLHEDPFHKTF